MGSENWIAPADRVAGLKPYFFARLNKKLADLRASGVDVIRLDIGSPDLPPANFIIEELIKAARQGDVHGYSPYGGTDQFRRAVSTYYRNRFGVILDPYEECEGLIGSKEGIFHLSQALLNPGDVALIPEPAYPTYLNAARVAGAETHLIPLREDNNFLPDLSAIPEEIARRAKILWLNYPNNPTGAVADLDFFARAVKFARDHQILLLHDAPYIEIGYEDYVAPSLLQVPDAAAVSVEFTTLSKSYNMAGWRVGMAVGNKRAIELLHAIKEKIDSSHFVPIQTAGAAALTGDQEWLKARNLVYQARRDSVLAGLQKAGLHARKPRAAIYVWAKLPRKADDGEFCERLVEATGVSLTPGSVYGESGQGYLRISLCTPEPQIGEAMHRLARWIEMNG